MNGDGSAEWLTRSAPWSGAPTVPAAFGGSRASERSSARPADRLERQVVTPVPSPTQKPPAKGRAGLGPGAGAAAARAHLIERAPARHRPRALRAPVVHRHAAGVLRPGAHLPEADSAGYRSGPQAAHSGAVAEVPSCIPGPTPSAQA